MAKPNLVILFEILLQNLSFSFCHSFSTNFSPLFDYGKILYNINFRSVHSRFIYGGREMGSRHDANRGVTAENPVRYAPPSLA